MLCSRISLRDAVALIGLTAFVWAAVFLRMKEEMKEDQVDAVIPFLFTVAIAFTIAIGIILSCDAVALIGLTAFAWAAVFLRIKEEIKEDQVGAVILLLFTVAIAFTIAVGVILS